MKLNLNWFLINLIFFKSLTSFADPNLTKIPVDYSAVKMIHGMCVSCHSVHGAPKVGPTLSQIQSVYKAKFKTQSDFVSAMAAFISKPNQEHSLFPDQIKIYGLMPLMSLPDDTSKKISSYLYVANLKEYETDLKISSAIKETPIEKGQRLALQTKSLVGQNLMSAINSKGVLGAVDFCNLNAQQLTSTYIKDGVIKIKRATDKPRNPLDLVNKDEQVVLKKYYDLMKQKKELAPVLVEAKDVFKFYAPIKINQMCLQCHGRPNIEINSETLSVISTKYPKDKALNYKDGDLRGIWSVEWKK